MGIGHDKTGNHSVMKAGSRAGAKEPAQGRAKKVDIRRFEQSLPMLLMRSREAIMKRFRPHLRKHDLTEQQWRILRVLAEHEDVDMLDLSLRCYIQPPSLSRTIPLLIQRGLVRRRNHQEDQRRILVSVTPAGRALFKTMSAESAKIYAGLESDIGAARMQKIYGLLNEMIAVVSEGDAPDGEDG